MSGDLLSAASLLLTVVAVLYAIWSGPITQAMTLPVRDHPEDNREALERADRVFWHQAIPLAVFSVLLAAVFFPVAVEVVTYSAGSYLTEGWTTIWAYDPLHTTIVLVNVIQISLAIHLTRVAVCLKKHRKRLASGKY